MAMDYSLSSFQSFRHFLDFHVSLLMIYPNAEWYLKIRVLEDRSQSVVVTTDEISQEFIVDSAMQ